MVTSEEMKSLAIGVITSAMSARQLPEGDGEKRLHQYASDFSMIVESVSVGDMYLLATLLGDICAGLVEVMAINTERDPDEIMRLLAWSIRDNPTVRLDPDE